VVNIEVWGVKRPPDFTFCGRSGENTWASEGKVAFPFLKPFASTWEDSTGCPTWDLPTQPLSDRGWPRKGDPRPQKPQTGLEFHQDGAKGPRAGGAIDGQPSPERQANKKHSCERPVVTFRRRIPSSPCPRQRRLGAFVLEAGSFGDDVRVFLLLTETRGSSDTMDHTPQLGSRFLNRARDRSLYPASSRLQSIHDKRYFAAFRDRARHLV